MDPLVHDFVWDPCSDGPGKTMTQNPDHPRDAISQKKMSHKNDPPELL